MTSLLLSPFFACKWLTIKLLELEMCTEFLERLRNCNIKGCLPVVRDTTPLRRSPESVEEEVENFGIQEYMSEAQINPEYDGVEDGIEVEDTEEDGCLSYTYSGESEDLIRELES